MKPSIASLLALAVWLAAMPASAQDDVPPAKKEKKICQTEKMTGSLTRVRRICMTRAEWDELRLKYKHGFEDNVRGASGGCVAPGEATGQMCGKQ